MKFGIFICVLVVLAYHGALVSGVARLTGNCQPEDVPQEELTHCRGIECKKDASGGISLTKKSCPLARCLNKEAPGNSEPDHTKTYPDCCPKHNCAQHS